MSDDQKLADAILAMVQLSPGERATVMSVVERIVIATAEVGEPVGKPKKNRKEYTNADMSAINFAVGIWNQMSDEARTLCVHDIARRLGRTNKAIRYQITSRLK
jgi:hypothetical protein